MTASPTLVFQPMQTEKASTEETFTKAGCEVAQAKVQVCSSVF